MNIYILSIVDFGMKTVLMNLETFFSHIIVQMKVHINDCDVILDRIT